MLSNAIVKSLLTVAVCGCLLHVNSSSALAVNKEVVRFRLTDWKSLHLSDSKKANDIAKTLKKLGCEAEGHSHGDHFDLRYRCVKWRSLSVESHEKAHQWESWLKKMNFETKHEH